MHHAKADLAFLLKRDVKKPFICFFLGTLIVHNGLHIHEI